MLLFNYYEHNIIMNISQDILESILKERWTVVVAVRF